MWARAWLWWTDGRTGQAQAKRRAAARAAPGAWLTMRAGTSKAGQTEGLGRRASRRPKSCQNRLALRPFQNTSVVLGQNLGTVSRISMRRIIMYKSVYIQLLSITSVFFKTCWKYLLMNRDLQFCTIRGGLEVRQLAAIFSVSDRLLANRLTEIFQSFYLKVDFPICSQST